MNFELSDEQRQIKETAREFLASRYRMEKVRELAESRSYDDDLWRQICELGWPGIAIPEERGGQGLGTVELAVLCEEMGYACAPSPFLASATSTLFIEEAGDDSQQDEWLPRLASGEATGGLSVTQGDQQVVIDGATADVLVLDEGEGARLVAPGDAEVEKLDLIDATRGYNGVRASAGDSLDGDVGPAVDRAMIAFAAELVGLAQRALDMSVDYAREREQFGRPIGAYQAVSHRCAEMFLDTEEARSLTYYAAWTADAERQSLPLAAAMAKARASDAAWNVTASAIQVHGGIGFTWEHDVHLLLKRARTTGRLFGTPRQARERVADLMLAPEREPAAA